MLLLTARETRYIFKNFPNFARRSAASLGDLRRFTLWCEERSITKPTDVTKPIFRRIPYTMS
jgi:hypothetical protein